MSENDEVQHAETSASSASRWIACPGSIGIIRRAPPAPTSDAADKGTRAHKQSAWVLQTALEIGDLDAVLEIASRHPDPDNMFEQVEGFCRYVWHDIEHHQPKSVRVERKLTLSEEHDLYGTADVCYVVRAGDSWHARVIDLKTGREFVDEKDGAQLPFYATAMAEEVKRVVGVQVERAEVTIYQPLAADEDGEIARSLVLDAQQISHWRERLVYHSKLARDMADCPEELWELNAGPHCRYCPAKAICGAFARHASAPAAGFDLVATTPTVPDVSVLSDDQLRAILPVVKPARELFKAVEALAIGRARGGDTSLGWGLESSPGKRRWRKGDEEQIAEEIAAVGVEPHRKTLRTITDVEKDMRKAKLGKADRWTEKTAGGLKLVPLTDGRTGLTRDELAALDFDDVASEEAE